MSEEEISPLRKFEIERDERIEKQRQENAEKHEKLLEDAKAYKENFLSERNELIEKRIKENQDKEKEMEESEKENHDNVWEKVATYVNFSKKNEETEENKDKDTSRLRKLLLELKNEKKEQ
eukprot:gene193-4439_t